MLCSYEIGIFLIILCILATVASVGVTIIMLFMMDRVHDVIDEMNNMLYSLTKETSAIHKTTTALSTSVNRVTQEYIDVKTQTYMPQPEIVEMIDKTIHDLLNIELALRSDQKIIQSDILRKVIVSTCDTYPQIDETYIVKKCTAILQNLANTKSSENE